MSEDRPQPGRPPVGLLLTGLVDLIAFYLLTRSGVPWNETHLYSFGAGVLLGGTWWGRRTLPYLVVQLLAVLFRGGVLGALVGQGVDPAVAILLAVACSCVIGGFGARVSAPGGFPGWTALSVALVFYLLFFRLFYGAAIELLHAEGYYWSYGQHLDLAYLDHPPMVGWLAWLVTALLGDSELALRLGALGCWIVATYYVVRLTREVTGTSAVPGAVLLMTALPIFFGTGLFLTPDAPLVACWAGALFYLHRTLIGGRRSAWVGVAVCFGLGMLSKYTIALLGPSAVLFMLTSPITRRWFVRPEPYLSGFLALAIFSPVIWWNARHDWISFHFQSVHRLNQDFRFQFPDLVASVLVLLTPAGVLAFYALVSSRGSVVSAPASERARSTYRFLLTATLLPLAVFVFFSLYRTYRMVWIGPLWLAVLPYLAASTPADPTAKDRWPGYVRKSWPATLVVFTLLFGVLFHFAVLGLPGLPFPRDAGFGLDDLSARVRSIEEEYTDEIGQKPLIVAIERDRLAGWLAFYQSKAFPEDKDEILGNTAGGDLFGESSNMYLFWIPIERQIGRPLLLVARDRDDIENERVRTTSRELGPVGEIDYFKLGKVAGQYYYQLAQVDP